MDFSCPIILTNRNFRIKSWNQAAEQVYGWTSEEACGKNIDELLNTQYEGTRFEELYSSLLSTGRVVLDVRHTARDGRVLRMRGSASLSKTGDGEVTGIVHVLKEERAQAAGQAADAGLSGQPEQGRNSELTGMLEKLAEDLWVYDIPSNTEWHSSRAAGGSDEFDAVHPDDWERVDGELKQAVADRRGSFSLQYRSAEPSGAYRWVMNRGRIEYDSDGRPSKMVGMTTDISSLKQDEQRLLERIAVLEKQTGELADKNRTMTDFFTNVSHEFKTPLSIMLVDLQLMEYRLRGAGGSELKDKLGKTVAIMRQNALRLLRLIGNLLDVTRIEAGFMKARLINADVVSLAQQLTESVRSYAANAGIELTFSSDKNSRLMPMDSDKLERIMLNLLSNAIKHTRQGGHIAVAVANNPACMTIMVKDDGEGIPEDRKDFIFDRFRQVNTTLTRMSDGSGIGLALTRALVELLQGRIWYESRPGEGAEFFVELPVQQADWQSQPPEVDGIPREKKVEMEFSDINRIERG